MSKRNKPEAKRQRREAREMARARAESKRRAEEEEMHKMRMARLSRIIDGYNDRMASLKVDDLRAEANRRKADGDPRIVGSISRMRRGDLLKMLTLTLPDPS